MPKPKTRKPAKVRAFKSEIAFINVYAGRFRACKLFDGTWVAYSFMSARDCLRCGDKELPSAEAKRLYAQARKALGLKGKVKRGK